MISLIAALDTNGTIGKHGGIPWRLPADLKHFRELTMGHALIMGRKTFESIGKALPGRKNIVLTKQQDFAAQGCVSAHSLEEALAAAGDGEVFVIGGGEIYREFLPMAERLYMTRIGASFDGDIRFPPFDIGEWKEMSREDHAPDEKNPYPYAFLVFAKK